MINREVLSNIKEDKFFKIVLMKDYIRCDYEIIGKNILNIGRILIEQEDGDLWCFLKDEDLDIFYELSDGYWKKKTAIRIGDVLDHCNNLDIDDLMDRMINIIRRNMSVEIDDFFDIKDNKKEVMGMLDFIYSYDTDSIAKLLNDIYESREQSLIDDDQYCCDDII